MASRASLWATSGRCANGTTILTATRTNGTGMTLSDLTSDVDFYMLGQRMLMKRPTRAVTLCVFDVLWLDGIDCTQLPYRDRRQVLKMLSLSGWCTVPRFVVDDA